MIKVMDNQTKLKDLRKKYKIPGTKIAEVLEISAQYYYDIEKGKRRLSFETAKKLADLYNVSLDELIEDQSAGIKDNNYDYRKDPKLPDEVKFLLDKLVNKEEKDRKNIVDQALIYIAGLESKK